MSFKIIDYLEIISEITTEWTTKCPSCGGKLKVKKENNAYLCVTQGCSPKEIRKTLGLRCKESAFIQTKFIKPLPLVEKKLGKITEYIPQFTVENNETLYYYNPHFTVKRVDINKKKKAFYPYFRVNNEWVKSSQVSTEDKFLLSSFYNEDLVTNPNESIIITEGEKCTDFILREFGLKCITPSGFGWSEKWLKYHLARLNLNGILVIPDHDKTGLEKAMLVQRVAWVLNIPCSIKFLYPYLNEDKDIADIEPSEKKIILEAILN